MTGDEPVVDGWQQPGPYVLLGQRRRWGTLRQHGELGQQPYDDKPVQLDPTGDRTGGCRVEDHLAGQRSAFGDGQGIDDPTGEHVDELHRRIAHNEPPGGPHSDGHLEPQPDLPAVRGPAVTDPGDGLLHAERAAGGPQAVVGIEPAGHCVAAEVDRLPAVLLEHPQQSAENALQGRGELLRTALGAQLLGQHLGEGGEAGDVGEQRSPADLLRQLVAGGQRAPAVAGDVGLDVVCGKRGGEHRRRTGHRGPSCRGAASGPSSWSFSATGQERPGHRPSLTIRTRR